MNCNGKTAEWKKVLESSETQKSKGDRRREQIERKNKKKEGIEASNSTQYEILTLNPNKDTGSSYTNLTVVHLEFPEPCDEHVQIISVCDSFNGIGFLNCLH